MNRESLVDFFVDVTRQDGEFLVYDDGYRSRSYRYDQVGRAARGFARRLRVRGVGQGRAAVLWSENRPEWVIALWGCLLEGVVVVPVDYRSSAAFLRRVQQIVDARVLLVCHHVELPADGAPTPVWRLPEVCQDLPDPGVDPIVRRSRDDVAEIIFTSGATAEPKGVTITHRNILANLVPIEREMAKYLKYARPFRPIRFLNLLPLSHMFGQAMATFVPPMLPGVVVFMRGYNPAEIAEQIRRQRVSVLVSVPKILEVLREHAVRAAPEAGAPLLPI